MTQADTVIILDFETTGLSPEAGDRAIEIGAVKIENGRILDRFQELMNPGQRVSGFIESYTGIDNAMLAACLSASVAVAQSSETRRDARALDVLKSMTAYTSSLDQFSIKGETFTDARLAAGLIVSNPREGEIIIDRSRSSVYIAMFDGVDKKEIYFHEGLVSAS